MFEEGHIIELNNQAKHCVINNLVDTNRIHLIFDYVEPDYVLKRYQLQPGTKIYQTRRSIDFKSTSSTGASSLISSEIITEELETLQLQPKIPLFIILGVQKCGTTSLYELILQHGLG